MTFNLFEGLSQYEREVIFIASIEYLLVNYIFSFTDAPNFSSNQKLSKNDLEKNISASTQFIKNNQTYKQFASKVKFISGTPDEFQINVYEDYFDENELRPILINVLQLLHQTNIKKIKLKDLFPRSQHMSFNIDNSEDFSGLKYYLESEDLRREEWKLWNIHKGQDIMSTKNATFESIAKHILFLQPSHFTADKIDHNITISIPNNNLEYLSLDIFLI